MTSLTDLCKLYCIVQAISQVGVDFPDIDEDDDAGKNPVKSNVTTPISA
jgi:hypothetical protein